jgi:hypothetical protein
MASACFTISYRELMISQTSKYCESWTGVLSLAMERIQLLSLVSFATVRLFLVAIVYSSGT